MAKARVKSEDELALIHHGATVTDLTFMFGGSQNDIHKKIAGVVRPCSPKHATPVRYKIRDVAPYLVDQRMSAADIEAAIRKMTPAKLPPALQDAFWKAMTSRLNYEERRDQLWSTERVVKILGEAFQPIALTIRMMEDTVAQETELTPEQREVIQKICDSMLRSLQSSLIDKFAHYVPAADEHGMPVEDQEAATMMDEDDDGFGQPSHPAASDDGFDEEFDDGF